MSGLIFNYCMTYLSYFVVNIGHKLKRETIPKTSPNQKSINPTVLTDTTLLKIKTDLLLDKEIFLSLTPK